eukprot:5959283-Ditylum_brightwellii.AAC.1
MAGADITTFRRHTPQHPKPRNTPILSLSVPAHISINDTYVTSQLQHWIRDNCDSSDTFSRIQQQTGLTYSLMKAIDWANLGSALKCQKIHSKICLIKFMHNWLNTGNQKQKFYKDAVSDCPVCCAH